MIDIRFLMTKTAFIFIVYFKRLIIKLDFCLGTIWEIFGIFQTLYRKSPFVLGATVCQDFYIAELEFRSISQAFQYSSCRTLFFLHFAISHSARDRTPKAWFYDEKEFHLHRRHDFGKDINF